MTVAPELEQPSVQVGQITNYWGTNETSKYTLPDGVQYFEFKIMNEGDKAKFQRMTSQNLTVTRDGDAKVRMDPAAERHELIKTSVVGWNLYMPDSAGQMVPASFTPAMLNNWLQLAPPKIVEDLEFEIRKANPWMQAEMTVEQYDEEITKLQELREKAVERERGESASATK